MAKTKNEIKIVVDDTLLNDPGFNAQVRNLALENTLREKIEGGRKASNFWRIWGSAVVLLLPPLITFYLSSLQAQSELNRQLRQKQIEEIHRFAEEADTALTLLLNIQFRAARARQLKGSKDFLKDDPYRRNLDKIYSEYTFFIHSYVDHPKLLGEIAQARALFSNSKEVAASADELTKIVGVLDIPQPFTPEQVVNIQTQGTQAIRKLTEQMGKAIENDKPKLSPWPF